MQDFTRGGQTTLHTLRMLGQVVQKLLLVFVWVALLYCIAWGWHHYHSLAYAMTVGQSWLSAHWRLLLGHGQDIMPFVTPSGSVIYVYPKQVITNTWVTQTLATGKTYLLTGLKQASWAGAVTSLICAGILHCVGKHQRRHKLVRGHHFVTKSTLIRRIRKAGVASHFTLSGVPLIRDSECAHILITGTTGTGKSVCLRELLDQIRTQKQRAIVYDEAGLFIQHYYREGHDLILNPLDARCAPWHMWAECRDAADFDTIAAALIPQAAGHSDPFWVQAARTLFAATAFRLAQQHTCRTTVLLEYLLTAGLATLATLLKGTPAEILVSDKIEKTALSVKSVLATYLKSLAYLPDTDTPFSIRDWIADDDQDRWLFIASREDKHETLKPLISVWLDIAGQALLSLPENRERRIWLCIDELASLQRLPTLPAVLAKARKFGGCVAVTLQGFSQLRDSYGVQTADTLSGLLNTRLFFRSPDPALAAWASKSLTEGDWEEPKEGFSYGANTVRDGVSLNRQRVIRPTVLATEIMRLPNNTAYLCLPGDWPVTRVHFSHRTRSIRALPFSPRSPEAVLKPAAMPATSNAPPVASPTATDDTPALQPAFNLTDHLLDLPDV